MSERREMHDRRGRQDDGVGGGVGEVKQDSGGREVKTCHRVAAPSSKVRFFYIKERYLAPSAIPFNKLKEMLCAWTHKMKVRFPSRAWEMQYMNGQYTGVQNQQRRDASS